MSTPLPSVASDPRWLAFNTKGFTCSCGEVHVGLFPINMLAPVGWTGARDYEPDSALRLDSDFLSENFCVWRGQYYAMRMRLPLHIRGALPHAFMYTVWVGINRADLDVWLAARDAGTLGNEQHIPSRLINRIAGYADTVGLLGRAFHQDDAGPPLLLLAGPQPGGNPGHQIIFDQREGIDMDRVLELFAAYGHEMRQSQTPANT